ncbi:MAG TPA: DUF3857 domain-containing protein, partial [Saprospiraceae bacterium]|nr:DUF3857 domain-containing protein [Saprospiraceae bacterium]
KSLKGAVYDGEGNLVKESRKQDIQEQESFTDYEFSSSRNKFLKMEYGQYPYTVEFQVRKTIKGFFRVDDFVVQRLGQSVLKSTFSVVAPSGYSFKWKGIRSDVQPVVQESGGTKTTTWKFANLPAVPEEPYHPYFNNEYAMIKIAPVRVSIDGREGDFSDWKQMGAFFYALNKDRDLLSAEMQATVLQMVKDKKTTREKIDAIYRYLEQNHRYVSIQIGIGGWQTLEAGFVEKKKYGDCKALSNYMHAMLKVAGIESWVAIIYAGSNNLPEWYDEAPIPYANHAILYVPGEDLWLECTSNTVPSGYLGDFTSGRKALLLTPQDGKILSTPTQTAADNLKNSHISIGLDEMGIAEVQGDVLYTGDLHEPYRQLIAHKKQADVEKIFVERAEFPIAQLLALKIESSESIPQANLHYSVKINNLVTKSGKRMFVPVSKINPFKRSLPANDKRVLDLKLRDVYAWKDTVDIELPPGYTLENMPSGKHIQSEFGLFDMQAVQQENRIRIIRQVEIQPVSVSAARYNEVRQFYQEMTRADGAQIVLVKT